MKALNLNANVFLKVNAAVYLPMGCFYLKQRFLLKNQDYQKICNINAVLLTTAMHFLKNSFLFCLNKGTT